jgi:hypothetical protein
MRKSFVEQFNRETAEHVVAHAKRQKSRGRNPSESYKSETNPRRALALALEELSSYEPMAGENVSYTAIRIVRVAHLTGQSCTAHFNGIKLVANQEDKSDGIVNFYFQECERRSQEYRESPAGKRAEQERREREARIAIQRNEVNEKLKNASAMDMELVDEAIWQEFKDKNQDAYGGGIVTYAERWAKLMQVEMSNGNKLEDVAEATSHEADIEGITGFMYGCAVLILARCWKHGDQLRRWHNLSTQIGNEGEKANESGGVLNPAMLSIKC